MSAPSPTALDNQRMEEALQLAESAMGRSDPNPRVGCVIGGADGAVFGRGATQRVGGPHAEVMALRDASATGQDVRGATAWVTLEPCAHHGRTAPCCDAFIAAGLARVVVALEDPFPLVCGAGIDRMRAAGIKVELAEHRLSLAAWQVNIGFFSRVLRGRPWVRVKLASSLDGRTALDNGQSKWITSESARRDVHVWRRRAGAVLTGIGTALSDDPRLDVRWVPTELQPLRVVLDSTLRLPPDARVLAPPGACLIVAAEVAEPKVAALEAAGAEIMFLPSADHRIDLPELLKQLALRGVNELLVEAGTELATAFLRGGLADELLLYTAPRLLGGHRGLVSGPPLQRLHDSLDFEFLDVMPIGGDLRLRLAPAGRRFQPVVRPTSRVDGLYRRADT